MCYSIPISRENEQEIVRKHEIAKRQQNKTSSTPEQRSFLLVGSFHDGYSISNSLPESISTKQVPNTSLHELSLRLVFEVCNEQVDSSDLFKK